MAKVARTMSGKSPLSGKARGGKLALFEVLQNKGGDDVAAEVPVVEAAPPPRPAAAPVKMTTTGSTGGGFSSFAFALALGGVLGAAGLGYALFLRPGDDAQASAVSEEIMPEVLDVSTPAARVAKGADGQALARPEALTRRDVITAPAASEQQVFADSVSRTNGLNYVLVQSYHATEEDRAIATLQALAEAGLHATLERDIPGWPKRICVVGVVGFERISNNPEFRDYINRLEAVSDKHRNDRKVKIFDPRPVHWSRN